MLYGDLINAAMSDIPADMTITMHLCRGNYRSTFMGARRLRADRRDAVRPHQGARLFHGIRHDARRRFRAAELVPKDKTVVLGLVTTKTGTLEGKDEIKRRIEEAAKYRRHRPALLSPQCGFASTEEGNTLSRGRAVGEAADREWPECGV